MFLNKEFCADGIGLRVEASSFLQVYFSITIAKKE